MDFHHKKTHRDAIWVSESREKQIAKDFFELLTQLGFAATEETQKNFSIPMQYHRDNTRLICRCVDSPVHDIPDIKSWTVQDIVVTDAEFLQPLPCRTLSLLPEYWHIWRAPMTWQDQSPQWVYNCFMNRVSGDRSVVFYELIRRNLLAQGLVSYNCFWPGDNRNPGDISDYAKINLDQQYVSANLDRYHAEHVQAQQLIPYNTVESHGSLEQCIIDSHISMVIETYVSDTDIVFSEKIFRVLQLPRPWLLYCSPGSVSLLRNHGFDVLDDVVDHSYDSVLQHQDRLIEILDQLETFVNRCYTAKDFQRFEQAQQHNQHRLTELSAQWPSRINSIISEIQLL